MDAINALLRPRRVAVIGASSDQSKMSSRPVAYLRKHGFTGDIYPVNPRVSEIDGLKCYSDIESLPETPDAAIILLGHDRVVDAVAALSARGTAAAIILASGFGEGNAEGLARQDALTNAVGSMRILGPNTIGMVNVTDGITLSASGALEASGLAKGGIGLISQSGGILGSLLSRAAARGIGFSKLIATGNESDLGTADFLHALVEDDATKVIALYMEGLRDPIAFSQAARLAHAKGKPIVVFKVGRSDAGALAAVSHTGALAGVDRVYDAFFNQLGIIRANTFADLLDLPAALATGKRANGKRVGVLTSTGGAATLIVDACGLAGIDFPSPDAPTQTLLTTIAEVDAESAARNPVDVTLAGTKPFLFGQSAKAMLHSEAYDALVVVVGSSALAQQEQVTSALQEAQVGSSMPLLTYISPDAPDILQRLNLAGMPAVSSPEACVSILQALQMPTVASDNSTPQTQAKAAPDWLPKAGMLDEAQSKRLFAHYGIPCAKEIVVDDATGAAAAASQLGSQIVLKLLDDRIAHKSELGGVAVGIRVDDIPDHCARMARAVHESGLSEPQGFLVQEMICDGLEFIIGMHRDPALGLFLLVGLGGVTAELLNDTVVRMLPICHKEAHEMIDELRLSPVLKGFRGGTQFDVAALVDAIVAFSEMGRSLDSVVAEAEINPIIVRPLGQGVVAVDGLVRFGSN